MKTRQDPSNKPYYRCLSCPKFRSECGGRPTRDLDFKNWCEYMRDVSDVFHLANAYIAKEAEVSIKTVDRIMAINCDQDIMRSTARRIEQVVLGPATNHICDMDFDKSAADKIAQMQVKIDRLEKDNERYTKIIDQYLK